MNKDYSFRVYLNFDTKYEWACCTVYQPSYDIKADEYDFCTYDDEPLRLKTVELYVYDNIDHRILSKTAVSLKDYTLDEVNDILFRHLIPYINSNELTTDCDAYDETLKHLMENTGYTSGQMGHAIIKLYDNISLVLRKYLPRLERYVPFNAIDDTNIEVWEDIGDLDEFQI